MENATEAMKMAFGVLMFVLALTISISCFSQARTAVDSIVTLRDRETQYTYVKPSATLNRTVGIDTVITTMYRAYKENFKIYFYNSYTSEEINETLVLYNYYDSNGNVTPVNYVDLEKEILPNANEAIKHLDILLGKRPSDRNSKYFEQFIHLDGIYEYLKNEKFLEVLGEYYQEDEVAGIETEGAEINKTKKRIITYIKQ